MHMCLCTSLASSMHRPDDLRRHLSIDYSQVSAAAHHRHLAAEEADALSKKLASSVKVDAQDTWTQTIFPYFNAHGDRCVHFVCEAASFEVWPV